MRLALAFGLLVASATAAADTGYLIAVSNRVTEVQPSAAVELWAVFEPDPYAFAGAKLDFHASPDAGGFSSPTIPSTTSATFSILAMSRPTATRCKQS